MKPVTNEEIAELQDKISELLERQNPYPESVFVEPDWTVVTAALEPVGITTDRVSGSMGRTCWKNIMADLAPLLNVFPALDRLAELEAAVAWHGFDELPEGGRFRVLQYKNEHGGTFTRTYDDFDYYKNLGFTGWRYPIGDLS